MRVCARARSIPNYRSRRIFYSKDAPINCSYLRFSDTCSISSIFSISELCFAINYYNSFRTCSLVLFGEVVWVLSGHLLFYFMGVVDRVVCLLLSADLFCMSSLLCGLFTNIFSYFYTETWLPLSIENVLISWLGSSFPCFIFYIF